MSYLTSQLSKAFAKLHTTKKYKTVRNAVAYDRACAWFGNGPECYEGE